MRNKLNKISCKGALLFTAFAMLTGCSSEEPSVDNKGYSVLPDGKRIPIASLRVKTINSSRIIAATIESGKTSNVDTARFYGIEYSEEIERATFQLPDGATITPEPATWEDSVVVDSKKARDYWEKVGDYTIRTRDNSLYKIVFKLEDFVAKTVDTTTPKEDEPDPNEPGTIFIDLFNSSNPVPDEDVWRLCTYANNAWSQHFEHVEGYENVRVEDGFVKLKASKDDGYYKNGGIRTIKGFPKNSRVEVKARLTHKVRGGFPAIWQMPINGTPWPTAGEIDIMEWVQGNPNRAFQTLHYQYNQTNQSASVSPITDVTEWHTYAVERTDETIVFFIDGVETMRYNNEGVHEKFPYNKWDYDIILNFSLGGMLNGNLTWPGTIHDEDLPGEMWVDWVRVIEID